MIIEIKNGKTIDLDQVELKANEGKSLKDICSSIDVSPLTFIQHVKKHRNDLLIQIKKNGQDKKKFGLKKISQHKAK